MITALLQGIKVIGTATWEATKSFVGWLINVMPKPLRFFFFLYMLLFLVSTIMPIFLGTSFSCASDGQVYKINFVTLNSRSTYIDQMAKICSPTDNELEFSDYVEGVSGNFIQKALINIKFLWNSWTQFRQGNYTEVEPLCDEFDDLLALGDNATDVAIKDTVLKYYGETLDQKGHEKVVTVGCSQNREGEWFPSLLFYTIDLLSYKLWLLLGLVGAIVPLAFKWYGMILK